MLFISSRDEAAVVGRAEGEFPCAAPVAFCCRWRFRSGRLGRPLPMPDDSWVRIPGAIQIDVDSSFSPCSAFSSQEPAAVLR